MRSIDPTGDIYYPSLDVDPRGNILGWDAFVARYSSRNVAPWAAQLGGVGTEVGTGVELDSEGSVYAVGSYLDSGDYDPSPSSTVTLTHLGVAESTKDTFLVKLSSAGVYQWAHALNSSADELVSDLTVDGANNLYVNGFTHGTVDFDVGAATAAVSSGSTAAKYTVAPPPSGLVPVMTSSTTPVGAVSASGTYGTGYEAWKAFDGNVGTLWLSNPDTTSVWLSYQFPQAQTVLRYELRYNNGSCCEQRGPKNWTLQGYNGSGWVIVDTVTNQTGWYANPNRTFTVDSPGSYSRYRLFITADNYNLSNPITLVSLGTVQFY